MNNSIEKSQSFISEGKIVWYNSTTTNSYKKARIKKIDRISKTIQIQLLETNEEKKDVELSKIEEVAISPNRDFLVSNLEVINTPELIEYMKWILSQKQRYFFLNKSLFFINTAEKVENNFDREACLKIINHGDINDYKNAPDYEKFLSQNLNYIKNEKKNKFLFCLGQKNSAKTVHFRFLIDYIKKMFLNNQENLKKKIDACLLIFFSLINILDKEGKNENFSFCTYKFIFDENFALSGIKFRIISLYSTFMTENRNIFSLPIIMYLTKRYYFKKGENLVHLNDCFKVTNNVSQEVIKNLEKYCDNIFDAFKLLGINQQFIDKIFLTFRILLDFINLKFEKTLTDDWELEENEVYQDLIFILKINKQEMMRILNEVSTADDKSMKFGEKTKSLKEYISTIVYVMYEKLIFEIVDILNNLFEVNQKIRPEKGIEKNEETEDIQTKEPVISETEEKYNWICVVEFCGFRNNEINYFDDFHINYLNERIFLYYADISIEYEKKIYFEEGVGKYFPEEFKISNETAQIVKLINNLRTPPGVYQILETVSRLNKNNKSFMTELRKFLKKTDLIYFETSNNNVTIRHSFGDVVYDFSDFVNKNKYHLSGVFKNLFVNLKFDFLDKHDFISGSVNKHYKSDIYRSLLFNFLNDSVKSNASFLNCFNFTEKDPKNINLQINIFHLEEIVKLIKELFPFKISITQFNKKYLEVYSTFHPFYNEIENAEEKSHQICKEIINYVFKENSPKVIFGKTLIFTNNHFIREFDQRLITIRNREAKWKNYLKIKMGRFVFVIRLRRKLEQIKLVKKNATEILLKLKVVLIKKIKFQRLLKYNKILQRKRRAITFMRKFNLILKKIKRLKETFQTFYLRFKFIQKRKAIIKIQRRVRMFIALQKLRKKIFIRKLLKKIADDAVEFKRKRILNDIKKGIAKYLLKQIIFLKNKKIVQKLVNYIVDELKEKKALVIQKNIKGYLLRKWFSKMKNSVIIIQKNMIAFMWRKNYLIMKNGMMKIQRLFRQKRMPATEEIKGDFYSLQRLKILLKNECIKIIEKNNTLTKNNLHKRWKKFENLKNKQKHCKPFMFSYLIDLEINENLDNENQNNFINCFYKLFEKIEKNEESLSDIFANNLNLWFLTTSFKIYIWGRCEFLGEALNNPEFKEINCYGTFPNFIQSGDNYTCLSYKNKNEIKFFGDFEIFGSSEKIKKMSKKITTEFNTDFKISQISCNAKTMGILSEQGNVLCWPFYNEKKEKISRVKISLKTKIKELACGVDFCVFLSEKADVYTITQNNSCGEAGSGNFNNSNKIELVKYFRVLEEKIVQIAAGFKHVVALSLKNNVFCWGSNLYGQLGTKYKLNYPLPRLIRLPLVYKSQIKIKNITAGKFSSFALLKNQQIYIWGKNTRNNSKKPFIFTPSFSDYFYKNSDFFIFKIKSVWNDFMEATYLQLFDLKFMIDSRKAQIIYNKMDNMWGYYNQIIPNSPDEKYIDFYPQNGLFNFNQQKNNNLENTLLLVNNDSFGKYVSVNNKTFSMEDVIVNWTPFFEKFKALKDKKNLDKDEKEFVVFFTKMKKVLLT